MGYRLYLGRPRPEQYTRIFQRMPSARRRRSPGPDRPAAGPLPARENRELRACEPRDLIERARDICRFHGKPLELTPEVLDLAWIGYFGIELPGASETEGAEANLTAT